MLLRSMPVVHYLVPISVDASQRLAWDNLLSVCRPCHDRVEERAGDTGGYDNILPAEQMTYGQQPFSRRSEQF